MGLNGKPDRPWLTTVTDDHSRAICGYMVFTGAPSALNTALSLRQAVWRKSDPAWAMCGIPDILHVDHGSDFTSNHIERTRFFGTVNTDFLASLPGHLGPGSRKPQPSLDLPRLDQAIGTFIATYNERPHQELGHSPRDAWVSDGLLPRLPDSLELLDGLLLTVPKHRTVQRDGIHFQGQRYLAPTLAPFVGHTLTIRYDPRDISEIRRVIYATNAIESLNARYRRAVRARGHFPNDAAALKCLYLVTRSLDPTGQGHARWATRWKPALNAFAIAFEGRIN